MQVHIKTFNFDEVEQFSHCPCSDQLLLFQNVESCFNKLLELIEDNAVIVAAVALGIAALEVQKMRLCVTVFVDTHLI